VFVRACGLSLSLSLSGHLLGKNALVHQRLGISQTLQENFVHLGEIALLKKKKHVRLVQETRKFLMPALVFGCSLS
jgi:hypothetical protein